MKIEIPGPGCANCIALERAAKQAVAAEAGSHTAVAREPTAIQVA